MQVISLFDEKERTVDEMTALLLSAGWKVVEVRRTPGSMWAYTTAVDRGSGVRNSESLYFTFYRSNECLKSNPYMTEWALPGQRSTDCSTVNLGCWHSTLPELRNTTESATAPGTAFAEATAITRNATPFNLAFNTRPDYVRG